MQNIGILKINELAQTTPGCIRFDKGSGKFPFPEEFLPLISELKSKVKSKYFHYPLTGGEPELKQQIVALEHQLGRQNITPENITVTHGGMSGLFTVFYLLTHPGDRVITNTYCFEGFTILINHFKLKHHRADLSDIKAVAKAINPKTKLIILNSPENPTGKIYTQQEFDAIVELAKPKNITILSDEVMNQIVYPPNKWAGPPLKTKNVIAVNSFSKNYFIPGSRIGWIATTNKKYTQMFSNFISVQSIGVNLFSQLLITEILRQVDYRKLLGEKLITLTRRKNLVKKLLDKNGIDYLQEVQGGMNFYVNLRQNTSKLAPKLLTQYRIAVIPGELFEARPSTYARLGFGAVNKQEIAKGLNLLAKAIK